MTRNPPPPIVVRKIKRRTLEKPPAIEPVLESIPERPARPGPLKAALDGLGDRVSKVGDLNYLDGAFRPVQEIIREYNRTCLQSGLDQVGPDYLRV